ncbi:hypothetical protein [Janibacter alkaliphilus]|uniref:DUF389 domain-containing protein n=1 Tax=Janibacter alkaliphilus TaxID=1069963 RepID=A0A852X2F5_9MICO|nr:hypothetical protein [Janibacter alkaliphilus]NYG36657.1 hypothetical protein [Janibacter alkaliphilus]
MARPVLGARPRRGRGGAGAAAGRLPRSAALRDARHRCRRAPRRQRRRRAALSRPDHGAVKRGQVWRLFLSWLGSRYDPDEGLVDELADKLLFGPPWQAGQLWRYAILMVLAAGISSMGVIADSTAVVVGAMLIAPLMTPLMAMALSLVVGWPVRLGYATLVALLGVLLAIGAGVLLG